MQIVIGCDHAGFILKDAVIRHMNHMNCVVTDLGTHTLDSVDYPDFASAVANHITSGKASYGILICGTGIGMAIAANKHIGIRAAVASDTFSARMSRMHNDANVLALGSRVVGPGLALDIIDAFIRTSYEGGRHQIRLDKIKNIEQEQKG